MKETVIELIDFNFTMSLLDFLSAYFKDLKIHNKNIRVTQSYSDKHNPYVSPSLSAEILYRKNRSVGFGSFLYDEDIDNNIVEFEGTMMEYRVQLNVYSNTRGEINKWCSLVDDALKKGEEGIPLNIYLDNGSIKQSSVGIIDYDYSQDVKNNYMDPNVVSYDFHTIYEIKMNLLQLYKATYDKAEIGEIIGTQK